MDSVSQQQPAEVSYEEAKSRKTPARQLSTADSVVSQVVASSPQLSTTGSVLSQMAESAQEQPEVDLADSLQFEEASMPDEAPATEHEADLAEGDYADEFEPDESAADATAAPLPQTTYDSPLGEDESTEEEQQQTTHGFGSAPSSSQLDESGAPHVATQLAVSDNGAVKLQCGLEEKDRSADYNSSGDHMAPPATSTHVLHVNTKRSVAGADAVKVQWSLDVSRDEPEEDAEDEEDSVQGKGRFTKMPSTPFPRRSIFSASGNMADDVDIFSMTQPGDDSASEQDESANASDFGGSLHRVSSDTRQDSVAESGMQLTPSYRQTGGRSLQQAADNEQPFAASWRPQPVQDDAQEAVTLAPHANSQTPSRQSSLVSGQGQAASGDAQSSLSTAGTPVPVRQASLNAAAAAVPATLPSHVSLPVQFSLDRLASNNLSRHPSNVAVPASAVSSRRSSFSARIERETRQLLGQGSNATSWGGAGQASQGVSRTASLSTNPLLSPELSSKSLASGASQESSRMVSKRSSFNKPAELSQQSSQISRQSSGGKGMTAAAAPSAATSRTASRQPSFTHQAALSRQSSQVSRQPSMVSTAIVVSSPAAAGVAARQASLTQPINLSRQASQVSCQPSIAGVAPEVAPSPAASSMASRQASLTQPFTLSRQDSQVSRQPSTASTAAASQMEASVAAVRVASRQASLTRPIALSTEASQVSRQPSTASTAAAAAPSEMFPRVTPRQPSFNRPGSASRQSSQQWRGSNDLLDSKVPSRQPLLVTRGYADLVGAHDSAAPNQLAGQSPSVSRTQSTSSQPRRSDSLEAMHRQMSVSRKATAVAAVAPAATVRKLSQDNEGMAVSQSLHFYSSYLYTWGGEQETAVMYAHDVKSLSTSFICNSD